MGEMSAMNLARAGCNVTIVDLELSRAERVAECVRALGPAALALTADVTKEQDVIAAVTQSDCELGPVDCMVSVIGLALWNNLFDVTETEWEHAFDINLKSFFYTARAVARSLAGQEKSGSIVGVCSVSGLQSAPRHGPYGSAKAGLVNLVRTMAVEWGPNIRVNAIAPGAIHTPRLEGMFTEEVMRTYRERIALGRPGNTDEIGKAALFLLSALSSYVTGHTLPVDGGWMAEYLIRPNW